MSKQGAAWLRMHENAIQLSCWLKLSPSHLVCYSAPNAKVLDMLVLCEIVDVIRCPRNGRRKSQSQQRSNSVNQQQSIIVNQQCNNASQQSNSVNQQSENRQGDADPNSDAAQKTTDEENEMFQREFCISLGVGTSEFGFARDRLFVVVENAAEADDWVEQITLARGKWLRQFSATEDPNIHNIIKANSAHNKARTTSTGIENSSNNTTSNNNNTTSSNSSNNMGGINNGNVFQRLFKLISGNEGGDDKQSVSSMIEPFDLAKGEKEICKLSERDRSCCRELFTLSCSDEQLQAIVKVAAAVIAVPISKFALNSQPQPTCDAAPQCIANIIGALGPQSQNIPPGPLRAALLFGSTARITKCAGAKLVCCILAQRIKMIDSGHVLGGEWLGLEASRQQWTTTQRQEALQLLETMVISADMHGSELVVRIIQAANLPVPREGKANLIYCKVRALAAEAETGAVKNAEDPVWDQVLKLGVKSPPPSVVIRVICASPPPTIIGTCTINIHPTMALFTGSLENWYPLNTTSASPVRSAKSMRLKQEIYRGIGGADDGDDMTESSFAKPETRTLKDPDVGEWIGRNRSPKPREWNVSQAQGPKIRVAMSFSLSPELVPRNLAHFDAIRQYESVDLLTSGLDGLLSLMLRYNLNEGRSPGWLHPACLSHLIDIARIVGISPVHVLITYLHMVAQATLALGDNADMTLPAAIVRELTYVSKSSQFVCVSPKIYELEGQCRQHLSVAATRMLAGFVNVPKLGQAQVCGALVILGWTQQPSLHQMCNNDIGAHLNTPELCRQPEFAFQVKQMRKILEKGTACDGFDEFESAVKTISLLSPLADDYELCALIAEMLLHPMANIRRALCLLLSSLANTMGHPYLITTITPLLRL